MTSRERASHQNLFVDFDVTTVGRKKGVNENGYLLAGNCYVLKLKCFLENAGKVLVSDILKDIIVIPELASEGKGRSLLPSINTPIPELQSYEYTLPFQLPKKMSTIDLRVEENATNITQIYFTVFLLFRDEYAEHEDLEPFRYRFAVK